MKPVVQTLGIVLPAYNEEKNIGATIRGITHFMKHVKPNIDYSIIVVNDGSRDNTGQIISMMSFDDSHILPVHQVNGGYGSALRAGFAKAAELGMDWVFFTDSDGQFDINDLHNLLTRADKGYDFIAGFRADRADPFLRRIIGIGWSIVCSLALGMFIRDVDCAFKLMKTSLLGDTKTLQGEGATINPEIFLRAKRRRAKFAQVAVNHLPRLHGEQTGANLRVIIKSFFSLFQVLMAKHA